MKMKKWMLLLWICLSVSWVQAQQPPFYADIQAFKKQDSIQPPPKGAILLIGSSSFTRWHNVQAYFPNHVMLNRGFGGSSLPDLIRYADDIVFPYQPKQILIYCGENDFAAADSVTSDIVVARFKTLFQLIRERLPKTPIAFVSIKPSPSRKHLWGKMVEANATIKKYLKKKRRATFIDVYHSMLTEDGQAKAEIFIEDNLHMNEQGYAIWQRIIEPYLLK